MIVAGIGYRAATPLDALKAAVAGLSPPPDMIVSGENKRDCPQIMALGLALDLPVRFVPLTNLPEQTCQSVSFQSITRFQAGSYCESCALAAAGDGAELLSPRTILANGLITIAIAKGSEH